jgi:hypothetical protein
MSIPTPSTATPSPDQVDVRGPRFAAWVTTAVLVAVLILAAFATPAAAVLLGLQALVFGYSAYAGPRRSPYGLLFAKVVAPRLGPPIEREPVAPLRFAQLVGFVFAAIGFLGFATGASVVGAVFAAFALVAAFLNAAFGICLGCLLYPFAARLIRRSPSPA